MSVSEKRLVKIVISNIWDPQKPGDYIQGIYTKKEENIGKYNSNRYTLELEGGEEKQVFGSARLDELMKVIPTGIFVRIIYQGIKQIRAKKKWTTNMKLFDVLVAEDDVPEGVEYQELDETITNHDGNGLSEHEDREALDTLEYIYTQIGGKAAPEQVLEYAMNDLSMDENSEDMSRLRTVLAGIIKKEE